MMRKSTPPANAGLDESAVPLCQRCGHPMTSDGACQQCGQREQRSCVCGQTLAPEDQRCPACDAEWAGRVKVRRRKRRRKISTGDMVGYAIIGLFVAVVAMAAILTVIEVLANRSNTETDLPQSLGGKISLAWQTVHGSFSGLATAIADRAGRMWIFVAVAGAAVGVVHYLWRAGIIDLDRRKWRSSSRDRPRRRA